MKNYSKAIAAAVSAVIAVLISFNVIPAEFADAASAPKIETMIATVVGLLTAAGVWAAPANKE